MADDCPRSHRKRYLPCAPTILDMGLNREAATTTSEGEGQNLILVRRIATGVTLTTSNVYRVADPGTTPRMSARTRASLTTEGDRGEFLDKTLNSRPRTGYEDEPLDSQYSDPPNWRQSIATARRSRGSDDEDSGDHWEDSNRGHRQREFNRRRTIESGGTNIDQYVGRDVNYSVTKKVVDLALPIGKGLVMSMTKKTLWHLMKKNISWLGS
ncbi:hypothetical protein LTR17_019244 [Elasticomyces elasticus]|nr:hypothetical protein LTR17_019244 [Elasticomyces elasticus]